MLYRAHKVHHGPSGTSLPARSPPEGLDISIKAIGKLLDTVPGRAVTGQEIGSERNGSYSKILTPLGCLAGAAYYKGLSTDPLCLVLHKVLTTRQIWEVYIFAKVPIPDSP